MKKALLLLACVVGASVSDAREPVKNDIHHLYTMCKGTSFAFNNYCLGYISAIADMMLLHSSDDEQTRGMYGMCAVDPVTYGASKQVFINWADKHPELWSKPMELGVILALRETWPCASHQNK